MACSLLFDMDGLAGRPSVDASVEGAAADGAVADGGVIDVDADGASATYNDLTDAKRWQVVDVKSFVGTARRFRGGAFDGRYLYLSPLRASTGVTGRVQRFDTTGPLAATSSWSDFDLLPLRADATEIGSAAYDGRFVYFGAGAGTWARLDTLASFASPSSWSFVDPRSFGPVTSGPRGIVFDGRYLYAAPFGGASADSGSGGSSATVSRLDTTVAFGSADAWSFFDVGAVVPDLGSFHGATFDGRYAYFVPHFGGKIARYDTQRPFGDSGSWQSFDLRSVAGTTSFAGAAFDGRYLYFAPGFDGDLAGAAPSGRVVRFDTQRDFSDATAFQSFDIATVRAAARGYHGATFDGRFVYFVPHSNRINDASNGQHGQVARYDTRADFLSGAAWSFFDTTTLDGDAKQFTGAIFDGRFVYFIPARNGVLVRFDARAPTGLPPGSNASFL